MLVPLRSTLSGLALSAVLAASPALAKTISFKADLTGSEEVPPVNTKGKGSLTATYNTAGKKLSWRGEVSGLTGDPTAAHFHGPAKPGKNAGVLVPAPGVKSGSFEGSATLSREQARHLRTGRTYFNIHTAANPNGEVRGQVVRSR